MMHGLNEGHIGPYTNVEFQLEHWPEDVQLPKGVLFKAFLTTDSFESGKMVGEILRDTTALWKLTRRGLVTHTYTNEFGSPSGLDKGSAPNKHSCGTTAIFRWTSENKL